MVLAERAYLSLGKVSFNIDTGDWDLQIVNSGRIPSPAVRLDLSIYIFDARLGNTEKTREFLAKGVLGGDDTKVSPTLPYSPVVHTTIPEDKIPLVKGGIYGLVLSGVIRYSTGFDHADDFPFCFGYNAMDPVKWEYCAVFDLAKRKQQKNTLVQDRFLQSEIE